IGRFFVKDIVFGPETAFSGGILSINKEEALAKVREDEHITECELHIVKPGDMVRLVPVKDAFEMRCRVSGGKGVYPGVTSPLESAAHGRIHALADATLLVVGKHWGSFQDGLLDMGGPFQRNTIYGSMKNLVLVADTDEEFERHEQQKTNHALRWAGMRLSEYVGNCLKELAPEAMECWELDAVNRRSEAVQKLPSVVYVMQPQTQMEAMGYNTLIYGWDGNHMLPTFLHPNEVLGGAVVSGSFMPCSSKMSTWEFCNNPTIKRLMRDHGKTLNFLGVIMSNLNVVMEQKVRSAIMVAQMAKGLGADGAIVAEEGYGNPDVDYIQVIVELEKAGVKTVGVSNECTGRDGKSQPLVALDPAANALVSAGNVSEMYQLPPMPVVLGELEALARDGLSGGWEGCVNPDGSAVLENNAFFCSDHPSGFSVKRCFDY
ncbi:glycine/sarcosine/betaine reductase component B subunit, partial [Desulfovibrio sp. OttesenSCG-928-I05]|nr:glycine/sarcosine/betaine reductase component B subunit [Desulfovibrio sp. OttesenSCG-928-I05]